MELLNATATSATTNNVGVVKELELLQSWAVLGCRAHREPSKIHTQTTLNF